MGVGYRMKSVLILNEHKTLGGAENYVRTLRFVLEKTCAVNLIFFEKGNGDKNETFVSSGFKFNKLIFNRLYYVRLRREYKKINPDIIIINNAFSSPITQFKSLKGYNAIQIVHDYTPICPKFNCLKDDGSKCGGYKKSDCKTDCKYHGSFFQTLAKLYIVRRTEKIKKRYIKKFIAPSKALNEKLSEYGYDSVCIPNPLPFSAVPEVDLFMKTEQPRRYIYVGGINENKGVFDLIRYFTRYREEKDAEVFLEIYGKAENKNDSDKLNGMIKDCVFVSYMGARSGEDIYKAMQKSFAVIIPSKWAENYPTVILEAMLNQTLVIGSDRGGIPSMLSDGRGMVFDINDYRSFEEALDKAEKISAEEYGAVTAEALSYLNKNNSEKGYEDRILKIIGDLHGK